MQEAPTTEIIKADARGRMRYPAQFREDALDAFEKSGMSAAGFAERCGVKYQTFAGWVKRRRKARQQAAENKAEEPDGEPKFLLAEVRGEDPPTRGLRVRLPGGAVASVSCGAEVPLLVELIRALG
jgi:transposase-like protein